MSWYSSAWAPYLSVKQRQQNAEREIKRRIKAGHAIDPVRIVGRKITTTIWGSAWCSNLESYQDYANRIERGRSYVRNGAVIDLKVAPLAIEALVHGSDIYKVTVTIAAVPKTKWQSICSDCTGKIDSLIALLQGKLSAPVMERLCRQEHGLFPHPSEIRFRCSCPDHATMCKHIAAVLYGVGARLDAQPELLFDLRQVDAAGLIANAALVVPAGTDQPQSSQFLQDDNLAALFGLDLASEPATNETPTPQPDVTPKAPRRRQAALSRPKSAAKRKVAAKSKPNISPSRAKGANAGTRAAETTAEATKAAGRSRKTPKDKPIRWW